MAQNKFKTNEEKWQAVVTRDNTADGVFYLLVASTGTYCRPSCSAKKPFDISSWLTKLRVS